MTPCGHRSKTRDENSWLVTTRIRRARIFCKERGERVMREERYRCDTRKRNGTYGNGPSYHPKTCQPGQAFLPLHIPGPLKKAGTYCSRSSDLSLSGQVRGRQLPFSQAAGPGVQGTPGVPDGGVDRPLRPAGELPALFRGRIVIIMYVGECPESHGFRRLARGTRGLRNLLAARISCR